MKKQLLAVAIVILLLLGFSAPRPVSASAAWYDGAIQYSIVTNCVSIIQGNPYQEYGAGAYVGYVTDPAAGLPEPNTTYYIHVVVSGLGNPCSGQYAYIDIGLPADSSLAITSTDKVYCFYDGYPLQASECPQSLPPSSYNSGMYLIPSTDPSGTWPLAQGHIFEFQIPVRSTAPINAGNLQAAIWMLDGESNPWLFPTKNVYVYANPHSISGNAGVGGATLKYTDGTLKTAIADSNGNYSLTVSYGWSGTVTPSKSGYAFAPAKRNYSSVTTDKASQNYDAKKSKVFSSRGADDGWILEATEISNTGGTRDNASPTFNLGDNAADKQYRAILSFDTSSLPDNAVITRVTLKIKTHRLVGVNPFTTHGNLLVDIRKGIFGSDAALQLGDFQATPNKAAVGTIPNTPVNGWYSRVWTNSIFAYINKTGLTQFRLRFATDDNNDNSADFMSFFSGNATAAANRPQLIIQYYLP